jgi:eukaryotic-like serine/threonine-protein kinase
MTLASDRASALFFALSRVPPEARAALLDEQCRDEPALRAEVERLLGGLDLADSLVTPVDPRASPSSDSVSLPPGTVVGDFIVVRQIGAGGTGVVHLAHQQHPPRVVALKVLRREFLASAVQRRFEVEAELLAQLQHPGIAQIYAAHPGDDTTPPFIAMELVNGPPITEYADVRAGSDRERIALLASVCDAVQHAHQRGVIHRDLKPGNILVGEDGQPKVLDFGVARRLDMTGVTLATETGQLIGTLAYMSPEQVQAVPGTVDTRTDIHALGVILFRLLAGHLPFGQGEPSLPELARRIVQDEATRLGTIRPELKGDIEVIVARAIAKEKERRYDSAAGLAADLRRYLAGQPISASADSAWYLVRRQLGRYRLALAASVVIIAVVAALAFYARLQSTRVDRVNVQLEEQLSANTIERGRLISIGGNHPAAEALLWRELFQRPDSRHAQWALWDIYAREPTLWSLIDHETGTQVVRFTPDNRRLVTGAYRSGEIHVIDVESRALVQRLVPRVASGVLRTLFTDDGARIVAAYRDGSIRVWDLATGAAMLDIPKAVKGLRDLAIAGDGAYAVAVADGGLDVRSLASGEPIDGFSDLVPNGSAIATDARGTFAIVGADDGMVTGVDLTRRSRVWRVKGHETQILSVAVTPDGRSAVSGEVNGFVRMWTLSTGQAMRTFPSENGSVRNFSFDSTGTTLAVAGQWRSRLWKLDDRTAPPRDLADAEGATDIALRADARTMVTCSGASGLVRLWDLVADARVARWADKAVRANGLAIANGTAVISAWADGTISVRSSTAPSPTQTFRVAGAVNALDVTTDGRWLLTAGDPSSAAVWDLRAGRRVAELTGTGTSRAVIFADDDRKIIAGDIRGTVTAWDWSDGSVRNPKTIAAGEGEVLMMAAEGDRLFVAHRSHDLLVLDLRTGRETQRLRASAAPFSLAVTRDRRRLLVGTYSGIVDVWDIDAGKKLYEHRGHSAVVNGMDISQDGTLFVSSSRDGSTRLWEMGGQFLSTIAMRPVGATAVRFLDNDRHLAIAYADGEVEIRDVQHFFRYAAGQAEYQLTLFRNLGEHFPRADAVIAWSRKILATP